MHATVTFDPNVISPLAVKKSAYKYMGRFSADIVAEPQRLVCHLSFDGSPNETQVQHFIADFKKEVLDQDLREGLKKETEAVRNLILAHAFSQTGLTNR